ADDLVVDLGVLLVGVDDPQPLYEGVADRRVLDDPAHLIEIGLVVQRVDGPLQPLAVVGRAEIVEAGGGSRAVFEVGRRERHAENLSWTARRRDARIAARSAALTKAVSAGNADTTSSNLTTRAVGVGAVSVRTQRKIIAPLLCPAVSSQFAMPGSCALTT